MTMPTCEFLERCEGFRKTAQRAWGHSLLGVHRDRGPVLAATHSSGQADYATGDDYRYVDWNRAARLDELVSRQHRGVETGVVELVLDRSASMAVGTPTKFAFTQQLATALGYFALAAGRSVRVEVPEKKNAGATFHGRRNAAALLRAVEALTPVSDSAAFKSELTQVARRLRRGDMAVVLSDLLDPEGLIPLIASFARPAEQLLIVQVLAAEDLDPQWLQQVRLCDVESGSALAMELEEEDLATYREAAAEFCRGLRRDCLARGIALVQLRTDAGFDRSLEHLIQVTATHAARRN
ncbi:MAG: DUF58 domain-containing protein [Planctomycetes bacterium]|nr:DUF58 domain-containing protein [Planctomycetota bacterium]